MYIGEPILISLKFYLVNLANPKSAILAIPLFKNTLATFISLWITKFWAKYLNPLNISNM